MAETLFSHNGNIAFYACVIVYLYGDLAIYAVGTPCHPLSFTIFFKVNHLTCSMKSL